MIPFASQRGGGQDLATHLMNAQDNERIALFQVRGAIAHDLHGAFAEWEAIGKALTRARQYLCCLSINPDERQGRLTRAQYLDYIDRAESSLGLTGQPRAIIFHEKRGEDGVVREHCHVVWSRTDVKGERAIPLPFFKEKLMAVTREFARDHGLRLPPGYDQQADEQRRNRQLSAYDCVKQKETGISHKERMAAVTGAWRRRDSARAFVAALEELGYVLARGRNQTRIVLVDFYGHTTALTRLIDDASVRARHVRAFLGADYAPEKLPTVEQAQEQAAQRRAAIEAFEAAARESDEAVHLARQQAERREEAEAQAALLRQQQHDERVQLAAVQKDERQRLKTSFLAAQRRIRSERARRRPRGLAAFLGRVSGVALIIRKVQRYRDRKRYAAYLVWRDELRRRQTQARNALAMQQALQMADIERRLRSLDQIEQRERESLMQTRRRERRQRINARHEHMSAMAPVTSPEQSALPAGPDASPESALARQMAEAAQLLKDGRRIVHLAETFERVSGGGGDEGGDGTATEAPAPAAEVKIRRRRERRRRRRSLVTAFARATDEAKAEVSGGDRCSGEANPVAEAEPKRRRKQEGDRKAGIRQSERLRAFNESARGGEDEGEGGGSTEAPAPAAEVKVRRRKRRRRRDPDRDANSAAGAGDERPKGGDSDSGAPGRKRRRRRAHDPPKDDGPPKPRRRRKPKFGPGT